MGVFYTYVGIVVSLGSLTKRHGQHSGSGRLKKVHCDLKLSKTFDNKNSFNQMLDERSCFFNMGANCVFD